MVWNALAHSKISSQWFCGCVFAEMQVASADKTPNFSIITRRSRRCRHPSLALKEVTFLTKFHIPTARIALVWPVVVAPYLWGKNRNPRKVINHRWSKQVKLNKRIGECRHCETINGLPFCRLLLQISHMPHSPRTWLLRYPVRCGAAPLLRNSMRMATCLYTYEYYMVAFDMFLLPFSSLIYQSYYFFFFCAPLVDVARHCLTLRGLWLFAFKPYRSL